MNSFRIHRRSFLHAGLLAAAWPRVELLGGELQFDVAVIGGGTGGCAAALGALRNGLRVLMTEETDWIGGQLTSQAVPPDEHPWIESFGCTRAYRRFRDGVRQYYRDHYPLTTEARARWDLNPGNGLVSRLTHEPRVALAVLDAMLAPYAASGRLTLLLRHRAVAADVEGDRVRSVRIKSLDSGRERQVHAPIFVDATETGELLPLTGTEYVTGFESRAETEEPHAPEVAQPANMQAFTCCFAVDYVAGANHVIQRPEQYEFWRNYVPEMSPPWPGRLLSWEMTHPITLEVRPVTFEPTLGPDPERRLNLFLYRRIAHRENFSDSATRTDVSLINWPQNDYWLGNLFEVSPEEAERHLAGGKQLSLSLLYWMQTEAPRVDGGQGWPGLRLRADLVGTEDGLAKYPYVRESRRIKAEFTVVEQHVGTEARKEVTGLPEPDLVAEQFPDSVGVGSYRIDLHPSSGGDNYIDISSLPFQIPMGALLPRRVENLLAGCKNLGVTHITNGCYRLHPVEWNIGEAAGCLAAHAVKSGQPLRGIRNRSSQLADFQRLLTSQGVELAWPKLTPR